MSEPYFHIVLIHPEIPQNTGTIGRLCVSSECRLHLVHPVGFVLDDKHLKRAGLDYWPLLDLREHSDFDAFLAVEQPENLFFFSTKTTRSYWDVSYPKGSYLVFGAESCGLPPVLYERFRDRLVTLPMPGRFHRSLNLANAVSVGLYEAMRQNRGEIHFDAGNFQDTE